MSKDRKKLLHIHSSVNDKQPTPATLELGELGVNNAKGNAFISTKNSDGEVVRFSEDETIIGWMEQKEVFPYEGYMRGADNSQVDGVTEQDLLDNKSNLIIKLNQVVPENTDYSPYDEKVNGAKDIYGNLINPISSGGYKDGAGLAIDMSKYVMIGANPSFSSITTTCHATLNGTTEIKGKGDGCGSKFTVDVANACVDASDTLNEYGVNHSNFGTSCDGTKISNDTTLKGKKVFIDSPSGDLTVDIQACNHISGRTNDFVIRECQDNGGKVEIDTTDIDVSASTTDVKSCDVIKLESRNIILTDGDCGNGEMTLETDDLCLAGNEKINVFGEKTNIGLDCDDSEIATNTRVFGKGTLITTNSDSTKYASQDNVEIVATKDIKEDANNNIYITANNKFCEKANDSYLYGVNSIVIGKDCDDNLTPNIIYWRNSEQVCKDGVVGFSATTVDDALDEVYHRSQVSMTSTGNTTGIDIPVPDTGTSIVRSGSTTYTIHQDSDGCDKTYDFTVDNTIVSMSAYTYGADEELAKKYSFWQYIGDKRVEIGEINIPKDHILKDVSVVWGTLNGSTFTPCTQASENCHWYIKLVWNVFDPSTGHPDDKVTYLPADEFITDIDDDNSNTDRGANVDVWYDGKQNWVSATTKVTIKNADGTGTKEFSRANGFHSLNSYTLNSVSGDVKTANAATNWTYDPFDKKVTITAATDASHINRKTVSWSYGDVKSAAGASYDPGDGTVNTFGNTRTMSFVIPNDNKHIKRRSVSWTYGDTCNLSGGSYDPGQEENASFVIPKHVSNLGRATLSWSYGDVKNETGASYDPGSKNNCGGENDATIYIPSGLSHLTDWKNGCLEVEGCVKATGFYQSSDRILKENIEKPNYKKVSNANKTPIVKFNYKNDEFHRDVYGVIAQDVEANNLDELVYIDENGKKSVDYTSLMILKIAYLENETARLQQELFNLSNKLKKLEEKN